MVALNRFGAAVGADDFYTMVAPILVRTIPPGEGEVARYQFTVPKDAKGSVTVAARLLRKVRGLHAVDFAGHSSEPKVVASHALRLPLAELGTRQGPTADGASTADASRFFAYGVALLRPGASPDVIAEARAAFQIAIRLQPRNPDNLVALGRTYLSEGDLLSARAQIEAALKLDGRSPRARAWLGTVLLRMGQLEAAMSVLDPLTRDFPRDKLLWIDIGLCHLKGAQYRRAADAFAQALAIDPTDAGAHYNLMRSFTALNRLTDARREEAIFHALQDDEPLTSIIEPFLAQHPNLRSEAIGLHTHVLEPVK